MSNTRNIDGVAKASPHDGDDGDDGDDSKPGLLKYDPTNQNLHLHYNSPAQTWSEALPVGNGRLGAMVYGRLETELLQLNEDSVWYGGQQDRTPRAAATHLPELRRLIRSGRHTEAEELVRREFFAAPSSMRHYEPLGKVELEFNHQTREGDEGAAGPEVKAAEYKRWLDLDTAMASTAYRWSPGDGRPDVSVRRDVLASFPDQVLLIRVAASEMISFGIRLNRTSEVEWETNEYLDSVESFPSPARIILHATPGGKDSNRLCMVLGVALEDGPDGGGSGHVEAMGNGGLMVTSAACIIAIGAHTTYRHEDPQGAAMADVDSALGAWPQLLKRHLADYQPLFRRTQLRLWPDEHATPADERVAAAARACVSPVAGSADATDPGLAALYFNYGRYLLLSCSRGEGLKPLPATLQGIWNPSFAPPWGSKYTININLQMNYWPAAGTGLASCVLPVVDLLERMAERGRLTAKLMYDCSGWCAHHNTDIFADTDPQDRWMPATLWPLGGAWLCVETVETLRVQYDANMHARLEPVLAGCVEFLLDFLTPSADGQYLVTNPSLSPENSFLSSEGKPAVFCEGSTADICIIRWAFELYLWSQDTLEQRGGNVGSNPDLRLRAQCALERLPPIQINAAGLVQEWGLQDLAEYEPGHRHVSHLLWLYPSRWKPNGEDLRTAASRVLQRRASHGGGHTGWSRAWLVGLHARLFEKRECGKHIRLLLGQSTMPNLLDDHPPFQIDGNFGGTAGMLECLVQARRFPNGALQIISFPALPEEWPRGEIADVYLLGGYRLTYLRWSRSRSEVEQTRYECDLVVRGTEIGETAVVVCGGYEEVKISGVGEHRFTWTQGTDQSTLRVEGL